MTKDASFEDSFEEPLRLLGTDGADLEVISALLQDAVFTPADIKWDKKNRECYFLFNRFRWENKEDATAERVRSLLHLRDITALKSTGIANEKDAPLILLSLTHRTNSDGDYSLILTLSGGGALEARSECLNVSLRDVSQPYIASSNQKPQH